LVYQVPFTQESFFSKLIFKGAVGTFRRRRYYCVGNVSLKLVDAFRDKHFRKFDSVPIQWMLTTFAATFNSHTTNRENNDFTLENLSFLRSGPHKLACIQTCFTYRIDNNCLFISTKFNSAQFVNT
jgi:hypothetical protein